MRVRPLCVPYLDEVSRDLPDSYSNAPAQGPLLLRGVALISGLVAAAFCVAIHLSFVRT